MIKNFLIGCLLYCCFINGSNAQEWVPDFGEVFKDDVVPTIRLYLSENSLDSVYDIDNFDKEHLYPATFEFDNGTVSETVENVGIRLRGNTSLVSAKKSFKISFNTFETGRKFYGLEKLNLNGEHNDPSIIRSKLTWDMCRWMGLPGSRANHVALYINDEYYGLYINIEHIDEEYTQLRYGNNDGNLYKLYYGCDFKYLGMDPDLYKLAPFGNRVYELKNNNTYDNYSDLSEFIFRLNNSFVNNFHCEVEPLFNIDHWLKYLVIHILAGHWDDPILNKNNAYLYHNLATGQIEYLLYDVDNTFGIDFLDKQTEDRPIYDWASSSVNNALYTRLLQNQEYKDRFSYYLQYALNEFYNPAFLNAYLDNKLELIKSYAEDDTYRTLDYGFTYADFLNSYEDALSPSFVTLGLKEFINIRSSSAQAQLDYLAAGPGIQEATIDQINVLGGQVSITAKVNGEGMEELICSLCYRMAGATDYDCFEMLDDGSQLDGAAGDGIFGYVLSLAAPGTYEFNLQAESLLGTITFLPGCGDGIFYITQGDIPLRINEIMANNENTVTDENGQYDDWVEIVNISNASVDLTNVYLTDNPRIPGKWQAPEIDLAPGERVLVWADREPEQGPWHADYQLSSTGEHVALFEEHNGLYTLLDEVDFPALETGEAWGRLPDGTGEFVSVYPSPNAVNLITSVLEPQKENSLVIFPNPSKNGQALSFNKDLSGKHYEIVNIFGTIVSSGIVNSTVSLGYDLPPGVYVFISAGESAVFLIQ